MDIPTFLQSSLPVRHKPDAAIYDCPVCGGRAKLDVRQDGLWFCYKCWKGGKMAGSPPMAGATAKRLPHFHVEVYEPLPGRHPGWDYLRTERNLNDKHLQELDPRVGPTISRVYFPCRTLGGPDPVGMVGRSFINETPKYLTTGEPLLWGLHRHTHCQDTLLLCEGVLDAIHFPNAIATLGKGVSQAKIALIRCLRPEKTVVCLDGDARLAAFQLAERLVRSGIRDVFVALLPAREEPDTLRRRMGRYVKHAERVG